MATETIKSCDVFKTKRKVRSYRVAVARLDDNANLFGIEPSMTALKNIEIDLCDRGLERLMKYISAATQPPTKGKKPKGEGEKGVDDNDAISGQSD